MKIGFAKADITPRVGVELCGFGHYLNRYSIAVRDRLWARAMAVNQGGKTLVLVSCDLIGVTRAITGRVRDLVGKAVDLPPEAIMVHCTHTHSGPNTAGYTGMGAPDEPYIEIVPKWIAEACIGAVKNMRAAVIKHAETPCRGMGYNREYDKIPSLDQALNDDWRPKKEKLTDTTCHILRVESGGRITGFLSYFGCHPVVCCSATRYIHGDYCGVATSMLEREHPGSVGLFLQGAQGDVNSCVVHKPEQESLLALDVIASRYARAVRQGLAGAKQVRVHSLSAALREVIFSRRQIEITQLRKMLAEREAVIQSPTTRDDNREVRMAMVYVLALRKIIKMLEAGKSVEPPTEIQGFRIGPLLLLGCPFETFQAIKNDIKAATGMPLTFVMGITNDVMGYATDHTVTKRGGYAADSVPIICGSLPYARIHDELVENMVSLAKELQDGK